MARIVGAPKVATGLSEAREEAGAIAEPRIARVCNANSGREMLCISRFFCEAKSHPKKKNLKLDICPIKKYRQVFVNVTKKCDIILNMAEKIYSEDYEKLLFYKQNLSSEKFAEITEETVDFFFDKYIESINVQYVPLCKILSEGATYEGKMDYAETETFSIEVPPIEEFYKEMKEKYIPQALNSFNPERITNKKSYHFITYLSKYYFQHAKRDLAKKWRKNMSNPISIYNRDSFEENIQNQEEASRIRKKIAELKNELNPLESQILGFLIDGKKQKDIILINDETGNPYTKGYISKLVKKIRARMSELLES